MTFHHTVPSPNYRTLRLISQDGRWEIGMSPYHHGMRIRMGRHSRLPQVIDFCMGTDSSRFMETLAAILHRLVPLAEGSTQEEIDAVFPWHGTRPDMSIHLPALLGSYTS